MKLTSRVHEMHDPSSRKYPKVDYTLAAQWPAWACCTTPPKSGAKRIVNNMGINDPIHYREEPFKHEGKED